MSSRPLARVALGLCVVAAAAVPFVASAEHTGPVTDRDDTKGPFDVRVVRVEGTHRPRYDVVTFPRWTKAQVWDRSYALVYFDTFGGETPDYYVMVRSDGRRMRARLWRDRPRKKDRPLGGVRAWRPGHRSFAIRAPLGKMRLPDQRLVYYWWVLTLHTGTACKRVCFDRVPDTGKVTEPAPGAGPQSPTPTPSISVPTPSTSAGE